MDRVLASEAKGRGFESRLAHHSAVLRASPDKQMVFQKNRSASFLSPPHFQVPFQA
jgi:hypothetical protein